MFPTTRTDRGRTASVVRWSYAELGTAARRFAKALAAAGVGKGTRVALLMGNRPEWVEAAFGVALAGGVLVPVNTLFEAPEIEHVLRTPTAPCSSTRSAWPTTATTSRCGPWRRSCPT